MVALVVAGVPAGQTLVVADADTGDRLLTIPVDDGTEVTLSYTHSVEKTPVEEVYVVDGTALEQTRIEFHSYGAGLPANAAVERTDAGSFVAYPNDTFQRLAIAPGTVAGHVLTVGEDEYDLYSLSGGTSVIVSVEHDRPTRFIRLLDHE